MTILFKKKEYHPYGHAYIIGVKTNGQNFIFKQILGRGAVTFHKHIRQDTLILA